MAKTKGHNIKRLIELIKKHYELPKCRTCECLQVFLTRLEMDTKFEKINGQIRMLMLPGRYIHPCLGCKPCPPAELFKKYSSKSWNKFSLRRS